MSNFQDDMFAQLKSKAIFEEAKEMAYDYIDTVMDRNVTPNKAALKDLTAFDEPMPQSIGNASEIIKLLGNKGAPATVTTTGGRYFGFVTGGVIPAVAATKWLNDIWDQCSTMYVMSPVTSKIETVCEQWLRELLGLPEQTVAGFVSGSSMANLCGMAAGRHYILENLGWDLNKRGLYGAPKIRIIGSPQIHGTVKKAAALLGLGMDQIEWADMDDQGRMIVSKMPKLDDHCLVILQASNVNSGAFEDFAPICKAAREAGAWVHIDGAFGLWAGAVPRLKHLTNGMELAHSWAVDGHKTLNTPYDSGIVLCSEPQALVGALQLVGDYIQLSEERDGFMFTPEMSRRARATELWAALKYLGRDGIDELIYGMYERSKQIATELSDAGFEVLNDVVFNQVMIACETDELTALTMKHVQESGECWAGGSQWQGRTVIRISVSAWATTKEDITRSAQAFINGREAAKAQTA